MAIQFNFEEHFNVPREKVYEALTDLDGAKNWMQGFIGIEKIKGTRIENGAVWRESRKMFGKTATEEFEVISVIPNREIKLRVDGTKGSSKKGEYLFHYILDSEGNGTNVKINGEIAGLKGMAAFFGKMIVGFFKKAHVKEMRALKTYLESSPN